MADRSQLSDKTLVEKTLLGDSRSFEELVLRHEQAVRPRRRGSPGTPIPRRTRPRRSF